MMIFGWKNKALKDIVVILKLSCDNIGNKMQVPDGLASSQKEILGGFITFLEGC